jgi:hypothetical protein
VFGKHRPAARRGDGPYLLLAGVQVLPADAGEDFPISAPPVVVPQVPGTGPPVGVTCRKPLSTLRGHDAVGTVRPGAVSRLRPRGATVFGCSLRR